MDANIQRAIQQEVQSAVQSTQDQLLGNMSKLLDTCLDGFQRNIHENQKALSDTQIAKIDENMAESYKFKKRGNEEQFKHNQKVFVKLREAHSDITTEDITTENISSTKRKISEGMDMIRNRQKLIKLADSSESGWRVVDEYVSNPLAEDSEDEKKIYKAQTRADGKIKKENLKRRTDVHKNIPYFKPAPFQAGNSIPVNVNNGPNSDIRPGRCFYCNGFGHWVRNCPKAAADQKNKISIFSFEIKTQSESSIQTTSGALDVNNHIDIPERSRDPQSMSNTHTITSNLNVVNSTGVDHLKSCVNEWRNIPATNFVIDIIENGYKIPFSIIPCNTELNNNKSARDNPEFVQGEIEKLLNKGCISRVYRKPHVVNPLTVASNKGSKLRLVLDARHINPHIVGYKHKYEDAKTALQLFEQGDFIFSYDLKSAYHHISIFPADTTYLGFKWGDVCYEYNVLPFGLSSSGYIFTKIVRQVIKYWRSQGLKIVMYLDDGLGGGKDMESAMLASEMVIADLKKFGFILALEKCNWSPCQRLEWLGFIWDMTGVLRISERHTQKLLCILSIFNSQFNAGRRFFRVKFIASIVGQIISMQPVFGDQAHLRTKFLYQSILQWASWKAQVLFSTEAFLECMFWEQKAMSLNEIRSRLCQLTYNDPQDHHIFSDASDVGFGGYVTTGSEDEPLEMYGSWSLLEQVKSSTWRELEAIKRIILNFSNILKGKSIRVYIDNKNVTHIINIGSRKTVLHKTVIFIHEFCLENVIKLSMAWIPRQSNTHADSLSRSIDCNDWEVQDEIFQYLDNIYGPHDADRFPHDYNAKCKIFNSEFWYPGTSGINSFTVQWAGHNNWLVPPPTLIPKVIHKMRQEQCKGSLIITEWTSVPFWPLIVDQENKFKVFIVDHKFFLGENLMKRGRGNCGVFDQQF